MAVHRVAVTSRCQIGAAGFEPACPDEMISRSIRLEGLDPSGTAVVLRPQGAGLSRPSARLAFPVPLSVGISCAEPSAWSVFLGDNRLFRPPRQMGRMLNRKARGDGGIRTRMPGMRQTRAIRPEGVSPSGTAVVLRPRVPSGKCPQAGVTMILAMVRPGWQ